MSSAEHAVLSAFWMQVTFVGFGVYVNTSNHRCAVVAHLRHLEQLESSLQNSVRALVVGQTRQSDFLRIQALDR